MSTAPPQPSAAPDLLDRLRHAVLAAEPRPVKGRILRVAGTVIHAIAPELAIGELCRLRDPHSGHEVLAEAIGLTDEAAILTPIGGLAGLSRRTEVIPTGAALRVPVGEGLLGRIVDALGRPLDRERHGELVAEASWPAQGVAPPVLRRTLIARPLPVGVRAIDGLLACGEGQRIGIYGPAGVGKTVLLSSIVKGTAADVAVIAVIGERGREVREVVDAQLGPEGLARAVVVVATSDRPAMERVMAAHTATAIAESFRDQGLRVLLLIDSITRYARAMREIGLAAGEPPTRRGFPPSVFGALPRLFERAGTAEQGSISAFYTILVEGEAASDPIAEETRALLDGHIVLGAGLANSGHFPAIEVLESRSRLMDAVVTEPHRAAALRVRQLMARYAEIELLVQVGEYQRGAEPLGDQALERIEPIRRFLRQDSRTPCGWDEAVAQLVQLAA
jgi:type III secretion protein N (ATPase)